MSRSFTLCVLLLLITVNDTLVAQQQPLKEGPMLEVTATRGQIKVTEIGRTRTIATVAKGTRLWAFETKDEFYRVMDPRSKRKGWIWNHEASPLRFTADQNRRLDESARAFSDAHKHNSREEFKEALPLGEKSLEILKSVYGEQHPNTAAVMNSVGVFYHGVGNLPKAIELYERSQAIRETIFGADHPESVVGMANIAKLYLERGDHTKAAALFLRISDISRDVFGEKSPQAVLAMNDLANVYQSQGKYAEAETLLRKCLNIVAAERGLEDRQTNIYRHNLATLLSTLQKNGEAERLLKLNLKIRLKTLGDEHSDIAFSLNGLGSFYVRTAQYAKAVPLLEPALELTRKTKGREHPNTVVANANLAEVYSVLGRFDDAGPMYEEALAIARRVHGDNHHKTAMSLAQLGSFYQDSGQIEKAVPQLVKALKVTRAVLGDRHSGTAIVLDMLGDVYFDTFRYAKAEQYFAESLSIWKSVFGDEHTKTAAAMSQLGTLYHRLGNFEKAEPLLRRNFDVVLKLLGSENARTASAATSLASLYHTMGRNDEVRALTERTLEITRKVWGDRHSTTAFVMRNLGAHYRLMGDYAKAERLLKESLSVYQAIDGVESTDAAFVTWDLAMLYRRSRQLQQAEDSNRQALTIFRRHRTEGDPQLARVLREQSLIAATQDQIGEAVKWQDQCRRSVRKHMFSTLPQLSEDSQLTYLGNTFQPDFELALSLGVNNPDNAVAVERSADWLLNGKASTHEVLARASAYQTPEIAPVTNELRRVRNDLAKLAVQDQPMSAEGLRERRRQLESRKKELEQQISEAAHDLPDVEEWVLSRSVRAALPSHSALVNIVRMKILPEFKKHELSQDSWLPAHYVAWILPSDTSTRISVVDLGEAHAIDEQVSHLRTTIKGAFRKISADGEAALTDAYQLEAETISKRLLRPIEQHLADVDHIILSPDGELWTLPWGSLLTGDGAYLLEKWSLAFAVSGRESVQLQFSSANTTSPIIFADPDFDLSANRVRSGSSSDRSKLRFAGGARFPALPGTAAEAASIKPGLEGYLGQPVRILLQEDAQEAAFKNLQQPQALVLSTHGFFREPESRAAHVVDIDGSFSERGSSSSPQAGTVPTNPLLRCGLALAGCNHHTQLANAGKEDGILTGLEIIGTNLRGTELVVLSACETGLGDVRNGEGVAGLRQAFQLAGAQSVVSSLWQVEDNETARLMSRFFENLASGMKKSEALRQAQLTRIKARRERYGAAHPFFWAAFTLTGQDHVRHKASDSAASSILRADRVESPRRPPTSSMAPRSNSIAKSDKDGSLLAPPVPPAGTMNAIDSESLFREAVLNNHPVVLFQLLPESYQFKIDTSVRRFFKAIDEETWERILESVKAVNKVLKTKKQFLANLQPPLQQSGSIFDALETSLNVVADEMKDLQELRNFRGMEFLRGPGRNITKSFHLMPELQQAFREMEIEALSQSKQKAVLNYIAPGEPGFTSELISVEGRWIERPIADNWQSLTESVESALSEMEQSSPETRRARIMFATSMFHGLLSPLQAAETQEQFDSAVGSLLTFLQSNM